MPSLADRYGVGDYPWEMLESETSKQFAAFVVYRDLGPTRTLRAATQIRYGISDKDWPAASGKKRLVERWSAANKWVQRAEEYDRWTDVQESERTADEIRKMKARHAGIAAAATGKIIAAINELDPKKLNGLQLLQMFDLAVKNERLARDVPNDIRAVTNVDGGPVELADVTDEALEGKLKAWLAARDPANEIEKGEPEGPDEPLTKADV